MAAPERHLPIACRVFGHRFQFDASGTTMVWECSRGCGEGGSKEYPSYDDARRYAAAFDHRDTDDLGARAPLIGLLPLRLWRRWTRSS